MFFHSSATSGLGRGNNRFSTGRALRRHSGVVAAFSAAAACCVAGCGPHTAPASTNSPGATIVRIGYQNSGIFNIMRIRGVLQKQLAVKGVQVRWARFPAGPPIMEALGAGDVDISNLGDTPPIFAQAASTPFVYLANMPITDPASNALLVPAASPIRNIVDLKGKTIALQKGSTSEYLLFVALQRAGLKFSDVQLAYLAPGDAESAFTNRHVDAWVTWEPYLTIAKKKDDVRVIFDESGLPLPGSYYIASRVFATQHPDLARLIVREAQATSAWTVANPAAAAAIMASQMGLDIPTWEQLIKRGGVQKFRPMDAGVVREQQQEADTLYALKVLPEKINVQDDVLDASAGGKS